MNAMTSVDRAQRMALSLERFEVARSGTIDRARRRIARRLSIGPGTFEGIVRARVKRIDDWLRDRLQALLVRELEAEMERLTHELALARQSGSHPASKHIGAIESHLAALRSLFNGNARPSA